MGYFGDVDRLDGFADRLSRALRRLSMCSLRVSVFAVSVPGLERGALFRILKSVLSDAYEVGHIDVDTVGILYYGPRPGTGPCDGIITGRLARDLDEVMPDHLRRSVETGLVLRALHVSSADILDAPDLMAALLRAPAQHMPDSDTRRRAA